jgi:hypothetical protein
VVREGPGFDVGAIEGGETSVFYVDLNVVRRGMCVWNKRCID